MLFGLDKKHIAVLTLLAAAVHELGHLCAMNLLGRDGRARGHLSGMRIELDSARVSYPAQLAILAAGPAANLLLAIAVLPVASGNGYLHGFASVNLLTTLSSLLPAEGYDGYGILRTLAEHRGGEMLRALDTLSFIVTSTLTVISLYLLCFSSSALWSFGLFFWLTLKEMKKGLERNFLSKKDI
jgi:Zn-dependent protease